MLAAACLTCWVALCRRSKGQEQPKCQEDWCGQQGSLFSRWVLLTYPKVHVLPLLQDASYGADFHCQHLSELLHP